MARPSKTKALEEENSQLREQIKELKKNMSKETKEIDLNDLPFIASTLVFHEGKLKKVDVKFNLDENIASISDIVIDRQDRRVMEYFLEQDLRTKIFPNNLK